MSKSLEYLINLMTANIVLKLAETFKNKDCFKILRDFSQSKTFNNLYNEKTELWKESPDYIIDEYLIELKAAENN